MLESVNEDVVIVIEDVVVGDIVMLLFCEGLFYVMFGDDGLVIGVVIIDVEVGGVVSVIGFEGVIEMEFGLVCVF